VDLWCRLILGSSAFRYRPDRLPAGGSTFSAHSELQLRIGQEVTGRCLAWIAWLPVPGRAWLERIGLAAHRVVHAANLLHDPER